MTPITVHVLLMFQKIFLYSTVHFCLFLSLSLSVSLSIRCVLRSLEPLRPVGFGVSRGAALPGGPLPSALAPTSPALFYAPSYPSSPSSSSSSSPPLLLLPAGRWVSWRTGWRWYMNRSKGEGPSMTSNFKLKHVTLVSLFQCLHM